MRFEIKPLVRPIRLRDYAEEYGDETIWVWVNLPRQIRLAHYDIVRDFEGVVDARKELEEQLESSGEAGLDEKAVDEHADKLDDLSRRLYGWFATVWSKHEDEDTHWTADEVGELVDACLDADPRLWSWIQDEHWRLVNEHREGVKKK
jgi:hypothetical protein